MTRIAVLGANGQVGAELCVLLANMQGIEVVPICRSRLGSAYLRFRGIACRHGQAADPMQAMALLGDCDVIVNLALVNTVNNPSAASAINTALHHNIATCSPIGAKHIYFSTMSVYGDAQQGQCLVFRNSYGQDKWRGEKLARSYGRKAGHPTFIFRLGHVCGELQGITHQIRTTLASGLVSVADPDRESNAVYVATICEAILKVVRDEVTPGTFDLMNVPQWTWRQLFSYEANKQGTKFDFVVIGDGKNVGIIQQAKRGCASLLLLLARQPRIKRLNSRLVTLVPMRLFRVVKVLYSVRSAAAEIASIGIRRAPMEAVLRAPVGDRFVPGLSKTLDLLANTEYQFSQDASGDSWPRDIPPCASAAAVAKADLAAANA